MRVVNMTIEHPGFGLAIFVQAVLAVVAGHRIVTEDNLPVVVMHFRVVFNPAKQRQVKGFVFQIKVMVAADQILFTIEALEQFFRLLRISPGKVAKDNDIIVFADFGIPGFDHCLIHRLYRLKRALIHAGQQGAVIEVAVRDVVAHQAPPWQANFCSSSLFSVLEAETYPSASPIISSSPASFSLVISALE